MQNNLKNLRRVSLDQVSQLESLPQTRIRTDDDVKKWETTQSYKDYVIFLRRLNESVVGHFLPWTMENTNQAITRTIMLLNTLDQWIDQIPPQESPQRFGNLSFRTWGRRLEERMDALLQDLLPLEYSAVIPFIKPYLLVSFGSFTRMDYGTGHEASFALFLLCLTLVRFFNPIADEERDLVLSVFLRYLRLCWRLQDVYRLEPAGSHGVWGLDDYSFLPYIFGSGQLRDQTEIPVSAVVHPPLPPTNLYFMAIMRIHDVKHGPFYEHSSQLHSIAVGVPNWGKVNSGLFKMYEAEVLGKRVVVQHIPLGGLLEWNVTGEISGMPHPTTIPGNSTGTTIPTQAPWASSSRPALSSHGVIPSVPSRPPPPRLSQNSTTAGSNIP
ncbi:hypothetical protein BDQ12DRAFT_636215 [Crucibulum laeve]|uniref:Serine/threonine-protein phosphatase 2A activator n=1 Tax=Crucibulum laeve TaxID=68775 RepID=A0A5C3LR97_9AGAR|nr:hypothetical protein BDQ12DRAFT_636215 [Crucibulum laeve]